MDGIDECAFCVYVMTFKQDICGWFAINDLLAFGWFYSLGALCGCYKCLSRAYPRIGIFNSIMSFAVALIIYPPMCAKHYVTSCYPRICGAPYDLFTVFFMRCSIAKVGN